jgi:hypothetical protein
MAFDHPLISKFLNILYVQQLRQFFQISMILNLQYPPND